MLPVIEDDQAFLFKARAKDLLYTEDFLYFLATFYWYLTLAWMCYPEILPDQPPANRASRFKYVWSNFVFILCMSYMTSFCLGDLMWLIFVKVITLCEVSFSFPLHEVLFSFPLHSPNIFLYRCFLLFKFHPTISSHSYNIMQNKNSLWLQSTIILNVLKKIFFFWQTPF